MHVLHVEGIDAQVDVFYCLAYRFSERPCRAVPATTAYFDSRWRLARPGVQGLADSRQYRTSWEGLLHLADDSLWCCTFDTSILTSFP